MTFYRLKSWTLVTAIIVAGLYLVTTGCSANLNGQEASATPAVEATLTEIPTVMVTQTSTPLPPVGVLLAPEGADGRLVKALQERLARWIPEQGLRFQVLPSLDADDISTDDYRLIVVVPPVKNLEDLIDAAPDVDFLAVGFDDLEPSSNLSVIRSGNERLDQQAFLAGYLAVMITEDWRVGMMGIADSPYVERARIGFTNGALFYCPSPMGYCSPSYAPFFEYPLYVEMNHDSSIAEWQSAAKYLIGMMVETMYIMTGVENNGPLLQYLAAQGVNMIGGKSPPESIKEHWVATLTFSPLDAFDEYWPKFVNGDVGNEVFSSLKITDFNDELLTEGKQRLANEMLGDLINGFIDTGAGVIPEEDQ